MATAASYQLMASYLVWDLHDLLNNRGAPSGWHTRIRDLLELLQAADRGGQPIYPPPKSRAKSGGIRADRTERLTSLDHDADLFDLVAVVAGKSNNPKEQTVAWVRKASDALERTLGGQIAGEDRTFLDQEVEPFLRRLERLDEFDEYRPPLRSKNMIRR
ncbi:MAG TPA: hypothetical protein VGY76_02535 [Solirubrobacteraceae bacterium]|nr:hypothetical protein [Solirubrobacteraceae bacterium]